MKIFIYFISTVSLLFVLTACGENSVDNTSIDFSMYEDAEDGTVSRWNEVWDGHPILNVNIGADGSSRSIYVRENWERNPDGSYNNNAHYELPLYNNSQFILEFDKMKKEAETKYCFTVGVKLDTKYGERHISFNPFYDKENIEANAQWIINDTVKELVFPLSMDYVDIANVWKHLRFDLVDYLSRFEPENEIYEVTAFYFQGGDDYLDNIRLSSE